MWNDDIQYAMLIGKMTQQIKLNYQSKYGNLQIY